MKPFVFLAARFEDAAADLEYEAFCHYSGLAPSELVRVRLEQSQLLGVTLSDYSGLIIGGSPFNVSDDAATKTPVQHRVEAELHAILDQAITQDFPVLGVCYALGVLGSHLGTIPDHTYGESAGTVEVELTEAGQADPLLAGLPQRFTALTGHKEALSSLPDGATLLATAATAPVQMIRAGQNVYAVQFHPELDQPGLKERLAIYLNQGYCAPEEYQQIIAKTEKANLTNAHQILKNFVALCHSAASEAQSAESRAGDG